MPADRKQVEEAVERLREWERSWETSEDWLVVRDIRRILTDHAAILARAEAAEARVHELETIVGYYDRAAHRQPAPVKEGNRDGD